MSTIIVDTLYSDKHDITIPVTEIGHRVIKTYRADYTAGTWNPSTAYNWVPGMYYDYTPASASSRIKVSCYIPYYGINAAHAISHWIFYANGVEQGRHSLSGNHLEDFASFTWDFPSWGTSAGRVGYQQRSYAEDNHETRVYGTRYWEGGGSVQNAYGQFTIEEYLTGV